MTEVYAIYVQKDMDVYGNPVNHGKEFIAAICDNQSDVEMIIKKIVKNPYNYGIKYWVATYDLNHDHSGYSRYFGSEDITENS